MARSATLDTGDPLARARDDEVARLVARNDQLEAENAGLCAENQRQRDRIAELERKVEELRRKAKRQAAPFSVRSGSAIPAGRAEGPGPTTAGGPTGRLPSRPTRCSLPRLAPAASAVGRSSSIGSPTSTRRSCPSRVRSAGASMSASAIAEAVAAATRAAIPFRHLMLSAPPPRCSARARWRSQPSSTRSSG